ncbi:unnamed protein product [Ceutorhynchus assimilis]|uniref:Methuselah N-terminal domain-containing protein n=1 Tax=Ceutorhynchus assimilis TaxID=467358 RepID=A0A9N9MK07_9CUCU|nr:unnamed protein product [Ceutorhynchus assimilis]
MSGKNQLVQIANKIILANYFNNYCLDTMENQRFAIIVCHKYLTKCCPVAEHLNDFFECEKKTNLVKHRLPFSEFQGLKYSGYKPEDNEEEFLPINLKDGGIIMQFQANKAKRELGIKDIIELSKNETYCFDELKQHDRTSSKFAAMFSLCHNQTCLQKCCPFNKVYDAQMEKCSSMFKLERDKNIDIAFINEDNNIENLSDYFLVFNREPACEFHKALHPYTVGVDRIFLENDGKIIRKHSRKEAEKLGPTGFCVDLFRENTMLMANGFFCKIYKKTEFKDEIPAEEANELDDCPSKTPKNTLIIELIIVIILIIVKNY